MKKELSPVAVALVAALALAGAAFFALSNRQSGVYEEKPGALAEQTDGKDHHNPNSKRH